MGTQGPGDMGVQGQRDAGTRGQRDTGAWGHVDMSPCGWMGCSGGAGVGDLGVGGGVQRAGACTELAGGVFACRGCARVCAGELHEGVCLCAHGMCACVCVCTGCSCHVCVHRSVRAGAVQSCVCAGCVCTECPGWCHACAGSVRAPSQRCRDSPFLPGTRCPRGTVARPSARAGRLEHPRGRVAPGGQRAQKGLAQQWTGMRGPPRTPSPVPATRGRAGSRCRARAPSRPRVHRHMSQ